MENEKKPITFTEHDLDHSRSSLRLLLLEHLVLKLFVLQAKEIAAARGIDEDGPEAIRALARALLKKSMESLREIQPTGQFHPAESAMLQDEAAGVHGDLEAHFEAILSGGL